MMRDATPLVQALSNPASVAALSPIEWTELIAMARAEALAGTLAYRVAGQPMPEAVAFMLADHRAGAEQGRRSALWEAEMCRRALAPLGIKTILLKGTAYAAANLRAAEGRQIGDLDILVPRERLGDTEKALLGAGWEWVKQDSYDDAYYRQWMHELPPLIHSERDRMIDVHHTILPLTARITPDAEAMMDDAVEVGAQGANNPASPEPAEGRAITAIRPSTSSGPTEAFYILSPEDRICHSVAHMFADGDFQGGLRNLWDIRLLLADLKGSENTLNTRATKHGLSAQVEQARRLADAFYGQGTIASLRGADVRIAKRLLARNGWGQETHKFLRLGFYIRSHWLRMPPMMLARHLFTKWRKA